MKPEIDINVDDIEVKPTTEDKKTDEQEVQSTASDNTKTSSAVNVENVISVIDKESPIIIPFGPFASGKSMTLVRISRYLRDKGYTITPEKNFRADKEYKERCKAFNEAIDTKEALPGTAYKDFLLVRVFKQGRAVCQFLEAPGEDYFNTKDTSAENFPRYMTKIIRSLPNRKIWVFITDAKWDVDEDTRKAYVTRIKNCQKKLIKDKDRIVILYNKVDEKDELFDKGHLYIKGAERAMMEEYAGLAQLFANSNIITRLWRKYNYIFVPFCTGYYKDGYSESEDSYPERLWNALIKCIRG